MPIHSRCLAALFLLCMGSKTILAAEFSIKVVDVFGRPVADAKLCIYYGIQSALSHWNQQTCEKEFISDSHGIAKLTDDGLSYATIHIFKNGYIGYMMGLQPEYVLKRLISPADVQRVAALNGTVQIDELRELLAGDFHNPNEHLFQTVFAQEDKLRPGLRTLITDAKVWKTASHLLSYIGVPEDIKLIVEHAATPANSRTGS
jgi:hypothetical protein